MADNITLNSGTGGAVVATDDDGVAHHQYVKLEFGADNTQTKVDGSNPLPVTVTDSATRDLGKVDIASLDQLPIIDYDTGGTTQNVPVIGIALPGAGGSVAGGTATNPIRVDPTGTTTQPVSGTVGISGTVAATQSGTWTVQPGNTANTTPWLIRPSDGTNNVNVKAASTAALAADPSLVVALSPNSPLPTGSNTIGALTANQSVNVAQINGVAPSMGNGISGTGVQRVTLASDSTGQVAIASGTVTTVSTVTNLSQLGGSAIAMGTGVRSAGTQRVTIATDDVVPASQSGTWTVQPGNTANTTPWLTTAIPTTTGGCSISHLVSAATTNATNVKASAGQLYGWSIINTNATIRYVKLHNTSGTPTAGSGVVYTIGVPGSGGTNMDFATGIAFGTGIAFTTVTDAADAGTTAVGASDLIINLHYK